MCASSQFLWCVHGGRRSRAVPVSVPVLKDVRARVAQMDSASLLCGPKMALGPRPQRPCS